MTKPEKREAARRMRREEGLAITDICRALGVAKSSVSVWVRDIELTPQQEENLHQQHYAFLAQKKGSRAVADKFRAKRVQYQEEGRQKAREGDPLHIAGCMLYWAEGAKDRNSLTLVNSDADLMQFYVRFLRECLHVTDGQITIRTHCYLGNGLTLEEIEGYWLEILQAPPSCLRKSTVNNQPSSSQQKGRKLLYGVCVVAVHRSQLVQHVYGAIQEYTGIDKPEWLM